MPSLGKKVRSIGSSLLLLPVAFAVAQASHAAQEDPFEPVNRVVFRFNDTLDTYALKPLAQGYQKVTPDYVEQRVSNVFANLGDVVNLANGLLQGKLHDAGVDASRVLFNTTFGVFGLFDVATLMGLPRHDEDFGQTLGAWGLGSGPYLVLPFLGPSSARDAVGRLPDSFLQPYSYMDVAPRNVAFGLGTLDTRANLLSAERMITGDKYVFVRNAYLQNREYRTQDGEVIDDF